MTGEILHGRHLGSTKLGIPTINQIPPEEKLLPESGVYVTEVRLGDRSCRGVTNVGVKPTIEEKIRSVLRHIFWILPGIFTAK